MEGTGRIWPHGSWIGFDPGEACDLAAVQAGAVVAEAGSLNVIQAVAAIIVADSQQLSYTR